MTNLGSRFSDLSHPRRTLVLTLLFVILNLGLVGCQEEGLYSATLVLGGEHQVGRGERLGGLVAVLEGSLVVEEEAQVDAPVYMTGGRLEVQGEITQDISLLGGELILGPTARLGGDLNLGGGELQRSPGAVIAGRVNTGAGLQVPDRATLFRENLRNRIPTFLLQAIFLSGLAFLVMRWIPGPANRVADAITGHIFVSGALGLLAGVVALALLVLMAFTIILIPVSFLAGVLIFLAVSYGWIAFGLALGRILVRRLNWDLKPPAAAALGTFIFVFLINLLDLIPLIEGILPLISIAIALGAVLLTRFGMHRFVPETDQIESDLW